MCGKSCHLCQGSQWGEAQYVPEYAQVLGQISCIATLRFSWSQSCTFSPSTSTPHTAGADLLVTVTTGLALGGIFLTERVGTCQGCSPAMPTPHWPLLLCRRLGTVLPHQLLPQSLSLPSLTSAWSPVSPVPPPDQPQINLEALGISRVPLLIHPE